MPALREGHLGRRIVIVGDACSGKSSLAAGLSSGLGIEHVELDALYWKPGWVGADVEVFRERVETATRGAAWVVTGNYRTQVDISWPRAESVVWLDLPLRVTLPRILARSFRRWRTGELLWGTNREHLLRHLMLWDQQRSLLTWTLVHHRSLRRRYEMAMREPAYGHINFHRIPSRDEFEQWRSWHIPARR